MKLFIALVTSALVALPGVAWADSLPDATTPPAEAADAQASATDVGKTAGCPPGRAAQAKGAPVADQVAEHCAGYPHVLDAGDAASYLCRVTGAVQKGFAENGGADVAGQLAAVREAAELDQCVDAACTTCGNNPPPGTTTNTPNGAVLAQNAAAGGSLPRTGGGELLGVAGLGLAATAALGRRLARSAAR